MIPSGEAGNRSNALRWPNHLKDRRGTSAKVSVPIVVLTSPPILDRMVPGPTCPPDSSPLTIYVVKMARLGGFLARRGDGVPGSTVLWRGLSRLTDIEIGMVLAREDVGNE